MRISDWSSDVCSSDLWIDTYKVDGFRIDTAKHVNPEFWRVFAPAMLDRAAKNGIPHFHIFGEYATGDMDPVITAQGTRVAGLPASLDFSFFAAVRDVVRGPKAPDWLEKLFPADQLSGDDAVEVGRGNVRPPVTNANLA